ncbi:hypothetical protein EC991_008851, partial [Linnemannia zychae]
MTTNNLPRDPNDTSYSGIVISYEQLSTSQPPAATRPNDLLLLAQLDAEGVRIEAMNATTATTATTAITVDTVNNTLDTINSNSQDEDDSSMDDT